MEILREERRNEQEGRKDGARKDRRIGREEGRRVEGEMREDRTAGIRTLREEKEKK